MGDEGRTMDFRVWQLDLVPVPLAARMVHLRAYGMPPPEPHIAEHLDSLAYGLAREGMLYAMAGGEAAPRPLAREELACGYFRHGGKELHFLDERAPILEVAVTRESIERAAEALRRSRAALRSWAGSWAAAAG
jgi:hypothetical protein